LESTTLTPEAYLTLQLHTAVLSQEKEVTYIVFKDVTIKSIRREFCDISIEHDTLSTFED
jgi:hypothetical protein